MVLESKRRDVMIVERERGSRDVMMVEKKEVWFTWKLNRLISYHPSDPHPAGQTRI